MVFRKTATSETEHEDVLLELKDKKVLLLWGGVGVCSSSWSPVRKASADGGSYEGFGFGVKKCEK